MPRVPAAQELVFLFTGGASGGGGADQVVLRALRGRAPSPAVLVRLPGGGHAAPSCPGRLPRLTLKNGLKRCKMAAMARAAP